MIDDYQRAARRRHIGSSDAAAVVGVDPWRNAADVFLEKTGKLVEVADHKESMPLVLGRYLEDGVLRWAEATIGVPFARNVFRVHPGGVSAANLDALSMEAPTLLVEAKVSGLLREPRFFGEWGDEGTDEVPEHVMIQVHHQFGVLNAQPGDLRFDVAIVPVLLVHRGFVMYRIERNQNLVDAILEQEADFWHEHVLADRPPPDMPSLDVAERREREEGKLVAVDPAAVQAWVQAKGIASEAEAYVKEMRRAVLVALGDAERGDAGPMVGTVSYTETTRAAYEVAASTFRSLRHQKPKGVKKARR